MERRDSGDFSDEDGSGTFNERRAVDDDDFDDFDGDHVGHGGDGVIQNQPFDEAVDLSDNGSEHPSPVAGAGAARPRASGSGSCAPTSAMMQSSGTISNRPHDEEYDVESEASVDDPESVRDDRPPSWAAQQQRAEAPRYERRPEAPTLATVEQPEIGEMASSPGGGLSSAVHRDFAAGTSAAEHAGMFEEGMYDPAEYADLDVSQEIAEMFGYITRYKPHQIELETKMRPFITDYIPAVGEIDPFVKVPRPDNKPDTLGLTVLDEPAPTQSDPTVLTLQLRATTKSSGVQPMLVRSIEHADKNARQINSWVASINDLHRHKPAPSVRYSKPMPDIESLMQIWPAKFEELLETARLPDAELSLELADLVRAMCAILDIPVYSSLTESLHVLFTLYSEFKANVHFQNQLEGLPDDGADGGVWGPM